MLTAVVRIKSSKGSFSEARALLDTCATANFITEKLVRKLGLTIQGKKRPISAINGVQITSKGNVNLIIRSRLNDHERFLNFLVVPNIVDAVPNETFPRESIIIPSKIRLADPSFHVSRSVDLLIGSGTTLSFFSVGQINLSNENCDLYLQKTLLGWVIAGGINSRKQGPVACNLITLKDQLAKFWELEEILDKPIKSLEETACERHYSINVRRDDDGRYVVKLPFKSESNELGSSKAKAFQRFKALERKFNSDPQYHAEYAKVMQDYIDSNHMTLVRGECLEGYYLPHHAVIKSTSTTTKVRVVFDASAKTEKGVSLNSQLMIGPTIQPKLFETLIRFRSYTFVMTADIQQMYRQIWLHPYDRRFQRVFWYHNNSIRTFELNTVTFGVATAPFLAIRTLHQLAEDEKARYPLAYDIVKNNFYVDDMLAGANSLSEIMQTRDEIIQLLSSGGFTIRKWSSNHTHILDSLDEKIKSISQDDNSDSMTRTLGIAWNSESDQFVYSINSINLPLKITKRHILSEVAKIFDPLGLLGPIILYAKLIMQDCWKAKIDWDETVSQEIYTKWIAFSGQLQALQNISIDRHVVLPNCIDIEVHGFCDASQVGYGAVLYVRSVNENGQVAVRLVCSKSKVAPIKQVTLPRLELCGALTLTRLFKECRSSLRFNINRIIFWSDSEIVLQWLKKSPSSLQVFIGNRVAEIQSLAEQIEWRHVSGKFNIADVLSRGQLPSNFVDNTDWFQGPSWLKEREVDWPRSPNHIIVELPGLKSETCLTLKTEPESFYKRFSSYQKLLRVVAYCLRWRFRSREKFNRLNIDVTEKERAERSLLGIVQREHYEPDIDKWKQGKCVKNLKLKKLCPFVDEYGLIRVGGRLNHASISDEQKHPILIPANHHVTTLIISEAHQVSLHSAVQATLYLIRQKFWLLDGKHHIRRVIKSCLNCIRYRPEIPQAKMSDLPKSRVEQSAVFSHVGIDYFGPISIKEKRFRNRVVMKAYGCLFICMATKAVHLEIVSDLTTEGFLAALRRFIGRRGHPSHIYSDNGTNFVGAYNDLHELYQLLNSHSFNDTINSFSLQRNITWHFNPPISPHFGGIWEAAVKSAKHHLKRIVGGQLLTFEQLTTLTAEIEAVLNSKPISTMSSDPNDFEPLTPAHFLIGRPLTTLPNPNLLAIPDNRLSIWRFITKARQDFWKRWHLEYLSELQKRQKWLETRNEIKTGIVVLLIEKNTPCYEWPLGVITEVRPGSDGVIRVVKIKTAQGEYIRNITQLCPLPHVNA